MPLRTARRKNHALTGLRPDAGQGPNHPMDRFANLPNPNSGPVRTEDRASQLAARWISVAKAPEFRGKCPQTEANRLTQLCTVAGQRRQASARWGMAPGTLPIQSGVTPTPHDESPWPCPRCRPHSRNAKSPGREARGLKGVARPGNPGRRQGSVVSSGRKSGRRTCS
jgi:hypothetical protein